MANRLELHEKLVEILGSPYVYFQPPETVKMNYPCIRYSYTTDNVRHADNIPYLNRKNYEVMVIDRDPESEIPEKIINEFMYSHLNRSYSSDNLNHFVITLYV